MESLTLRITKTAHRKLKLLAAHEHMPMQAVLDKAVEAYRRRVFLEGANESYATLRKNPAAWKDLLKERAAWDATLADGLEDD